MHMSKFFKGVAAEWTHINWPTRQETIIATVVVIAVSLVVAYYLGLLDWVFTLGLEQVISR